MRGKRAKKMRREIYGDYSQRERLYQGMGVEGPLALLRLILERRPVVGSHPREQNMGTVRCAGRRAAYQAAKKAAGR